MNFKRIFILIILSTIFNPIWGQKNTLISGKVVAEGKGIANVNVTDGKQMTTTDNKGNFKLWCESDRKFVYYSLPSGYESPTERGIPVFYQKIDKDSPKQKMIFNLKKSDKEQLNHTFLVWADPQVKELEEFDQLQKVVDDMKETINTYPKNQTIIALSCGDNVFDELQFYDQYKDQTKQLQVPFYQAIGNHDMDYNERSFYASDDSFTNSFGPSYYSFNVGKIHYITLNDVFYYGYSYKYIGYIDEIQLQWLEQDLNKIEKGTTVVINLHIPTVFGDTEKVKYDALIANSVMNNKVLFKILAPFNVHILSGHSHMQWNTIIAPNIIEHTHAAACAAWWQGEIGTDGTPKGYTVYEVSGSNISWYFKGVGFDKREQFKVYPIGSDTDNPSAFVANVYNYDDLWKVEWYENGIKQGDMQRYWGFDPTSKEIYKTGQNKKYSWLNTRETHHLFKAVPQFEHSKIWVEVTDRFGNKFQEVVRE